MRDTSHSFVFRLIVVLHLFHDDLQFGEEVHFVGRESVIQRESCYKSLILGFIISGEEGEAERVGELILYMISTLAPLPLLLETPSTYTCQ